MQIGDYLAERIIETSDNVTGTATVHLARHVTTNVPAYLTVFTPNAGTDGKLWVARIRAIRALEHPGLVPFITGGKAPDGTLYVVTNAYPTVVKLDSELSIGAILKMSKQISEALDYAHAHDLVHGRLDRQHIVLVNAGQVAIRGFELSEVNDRYEDDIRGLAAFIHIALTGEDVTSDEYGETLDPDLPLPIAGVLQAALTTAPYANVAEFHQAFEVAARQVVAEKRATETVTAVVPPQSRPRSLWLMLLIVLLLIGAGLFGLYFATQNAAGAHTPTIVALASTATLTLNETATDVSTATPTDAPTATLAATATETAQPTSTSTATDDLTAVALLAETATPAETVTTAPTATPTDPPSATPTDVPPTATVTATITDTATETAIPPTETPTPTASDTLTPSPSGLVTATPMETLLPTPTQSNTPFPSETPTQSNTPFPSDTPNASVTPIPPTSAAELYTQPCIAMVGDSVTAGTGVYEILGYGYAFIQAQHVSTFVEQRFREVGKDIKGINRGAPNTGISSSNHPSYFVTAEYNALLQDNCRYTVIMPWINDITPLMPAETASQRHAKVIGDLVSTIIANNPYGRVIVLNYWEGVVSDFARRTWAAGFNTEDINFYNNAIAASCTGGALSQMHQVVCVNSHDIFAGMGETYVIKTTTHDELYNLVLEPPANNSKLLLDAFFGNNPDGTILGDGVHLSPAGKRRLSEFLVDTILSLPPL